VLGDEEEAERGVVRDVWGGREERGLGWDVFSCVVF
jgi:hypothetical protein